jgi:FXYD domain-containing ion transport regulator 3
MEERTWAGPDIPSVLLPDWHSLRVGGLICAGVLCAVGIIVLMSECKSWRGG